MKKLIAVVRRIGQDRRAAYYYGQKGIRPYGVRKVLASTVSRVRRRPSPQILSERSMTWLAGLATDGYVLLPDMLSKAQLNDVRGYLIELNCVDPALPELGEFNVHRELSPRTRIARFHPTDLLGCPHLLAAANDAELLSTIGRYIGCEPTMTLFEAWWSFPNDDIASGSADAYQEYQFHRDVEDFRFVKLFIYLSDVDDTSGPHVYVPGSHDDSRLTQRASLDPRDVVEAFGSSTPLVVLGSEGLGILEDTFGIHRATPPTDARRLICSVTYSLTGLNPFSPQRPLGELPAGMKPYVNRLFCHQ